MSLMIKSPAGPTTHKVAQLTVWSAYRPQPGSGESPTLPGDLKGAPDVETPAQYL